MKGEGKDYSVNNFFGNKIITARKIRRLKLDGCQDIERFENNRERVKQCHQKFQLY